MVQKSETYYRIKLALSENVGPMTYRYLMKYFKTAKAAVEQLPDMSKRGGRRRSVKVAPDSCVDEQLERAEKEGVSILTSDSDEYPRLLKEIEDRPPLLFVKGHTCLFDNICLGIVGSRNCSINGQMLTRKIAAELAKNNYSVVSGMARGIDTAAHTGVLASCNQKGGTIAVLGPGVDQIYPKENELLYRDIAERGCLVSELPLGTTPLPAFFPRRNRIISGLSVGVLVIEANRLSGSLITAHCALDQNREIFAVPGSPADIRSEGPNKLIKEGAHLVTCAEDIMQILDFNSTKLLMESVRKVEPDYPYFFDKDDLDKARAIITARLGPESITVNQLIRGTEIPVDIVNVILVELELAGRIERFAGGRVSLTYTNEWSY